MVDERQLRLIEDARDDPLFDGVGAKQALALVAEVRRLRGENARLREALAFAQSVIKSGEPWTQTCEDVIGGALRAA
jgi:hypothetical protein